MHMGAENKQPRVELELLLELWLVTIKTNPCKGEQLLVA